MKTTIEMAREAAGDDWGLFQEYMPEIHRLVELVRADERARMAEQKPVTLKWQQAPIRTAWRDDMVVASVAIDNDHTLSLYCERDQTPKVEAMFTQRTWVGLTDQEIEQGCKESWVTEQAWQSAVWWAEARLKEKNT